MIGRMAGIALQQLAETRREADTERPAPVPAPPPLNALAAAMGNRAFSALVARQMGDVKLAEHKQEVLAKLKLDYAKAEAQNKRYAKATTTGAPGSLGWEGKLAGVADGAALDALWKAGKHNEFADAVAALQYDLGDRGKSLDGILGPGTWARLGGLGEAMAGIDDVVFKHSEDLCYKASEERIKRGYKRATGESFELPEGADATSFETIIAVHAHRMLDVDEQYRGAGAAGALVYSGMGSFVSEGDIWAGRLKPGAPIQVWKHKGSYELLRKGEITKGGKTRRLREGDADFYGTSYVFVRYDTASNERVLVRHFGSLEWVSKGAWAVWVAANPALPAAAP
jgi:hypothetical protein